jgi:hypothetical protein
LMRASGARVRFSGTSAATAVIFPAVPALMSREPW